MATLRIPAPLYVSPQDATQARANSETETLSDDHGNKVRAGELAKCRPANAIKKGLRAYPKGCASTPRTSF